MILDRDPNNKPLVTLTITINDRHAMLLVRILLFLLTGVLYAILAKLGVNLPMHLRP